MEKPKAYSPKQSGLESRQIQACSTLQPIRWQDYFEVVGFAEKDQDQIELALQQLSEIPAFANKVREAKKLQVNYYLLRWYDSGKKPPAKAVEYMNSMKITIQPQEWFYSSLSAAAADFTNCAVPLRDKNRKIFYISPGTKMEVASLQHFIVHEVSHLADPILLIWSADKKVSQEFATLLPPAMCSFDPKNTEQNRILEKFAVDRTDQIISPHYPEGMRLIYKSVPASAYTLLTGIEPNLEVWRVHTEKSMRNSPLQAVDTMRIALSQTIDRMAKAVLSGEAVAPFEKRELRAKNTSMFKKAAHDISEYFRKATYPPEHLLQNYIDPQDRIYVELAMRGLQKNENGKTCKPATYQWR